MSRVGVDVATSGSIDWECYGRYFTLLAACSYMLVS